MTLRLRFTLVTTALVLALLLGARTAVHGLEDARTERDLERATADLLTERFPAGPPPPRAPGAPPARESVPALASGGDAVLLYAPLHRGAGWSHVRHTGETVALPEALAEAPPPVPSAPRVDDVERGGRRWRRRVELVAQRAPPPEEFSRRDPAAPDPGRERPLRVPRPEDFGRYPPEGLPPAEPRAAPVPAPVTPRPPAADLPPELRDALLRRPGAAVLLGVLWYDRGPLDAQREQRLVTLDLVLLGALLAGAALAWLAAGVMLRPLGRTVRAAEAIDAVSQRLPARASSDELGRLVSVVNAMLGRLEQAAQRERTFLASASHELRRPLAALTGELELALRGTPAGGAAPAEAALRESVALALSDARAMGRLVGDLMDHARLEAGALPLRREDVPLSEVVEEAVARARRALGTALDVRVEPLPPVVLHADRAALVRVLENLVENAGTHGGPGVHVTVRAEARPRLVLHVEDDGPGIPAADLPQLFAPFHRGDQAHARPGTGLGLSIARELARAHGGDLVATSPLPTGPGTRFTLTLD